MHSEAGTSTYTVDDITCSHCVMSVTEETSSIFGVHHVDVDLASGQVTITSDSDVNPSLVQHAVEDAGYQLAVH